MKKALIVGATGAMGTYLTEKLLREGWAVDGVCLDQPETALPNLRYITVKDARDPEFIREIMKNHYDAVVDFMI